MRHALTIALILTCASAARAEILDTTGSLGPGKLSFASEFEGIVRPAESFMINFHQAVGLFNGLDLVLRQGFGAVSSDMFYLGFGLKWTILSRNKSRPGIAFWGNGHYWVNGPRAGADSYAGADATLMIDFRVGRVTPMFAIDSDLDFGSGDVAVLLGFFFGLGITVNEHVQWIIEGGPKWDLTRDGPDAHWISTGPRIYFW